MTQQPAREVRRLVKRYQRLHRLPVVPWSKMSEPERDAYFAWFTRRYDYQPGLYALRQRWGVYR